MMEGQCDLPVDLYITGVTVVLECDGLNGVKEKELGIGSYGTVLELSWQGTSCAGKRIHSAIAKDKFVQDFQRECSTWSKLRHPYVAQFLGLYREPRSVHPIIVMEKMDVSLDGLLVQQRPPKKFPFALKVRILHHVALGLTYLHGCTPMVLHRDLHPNNVLIDRASMTAKLADFGVAKVLVSDSILTRQPGHPAFMPPEVDEEQPASLKTGYHDRIDVFSFGGVVITIMTHEWPKVKPATVIKDGEKIALTELKRREASLAQFTDEQHCFLPLVESCLQDVPQHRPTSVQLADEIGKQIEKGGVEMVTASLLHQCELQKNLGDKQQELEEANCKVQELTDCLSEKEKYIQTIHAKVETLEATTEQLQREAGDAQSNARELSNQLSTMNEHLQDLEAKQQQLKEHHIRELHQVQQQLAKLQLQLLLNTEKRPPITSHGMAEGQKVCRNDAQASKIEQDVMEPIEQMIERLALSQMYLNVEGEGTKQHRKVKAKLHAVREHIDDLVDEVDCKANPLCEEAMRCSKDYNDFNLGYRILFCSLLQLCYDTCKWALVHQVTQEAVKHWRNDVSVFSCDVSLMMQDSMADECHYLETIAPCLVSQVFNPSVSVPDEEVKQYTAVYKLIAEYMKTFPKDYPSVILEEMKAGKGLEHVSVDPNVEDFLNKTVPMCWELVTIYNPPIFVCGGSISKDAPIVINGAFHQKHPESHGNSNAIQSFLFPMVYKDYGGDVEQKAMVLTKWL